MADKINCEIWIVMDENGNWSASMERDDAVSDVGAEDGACMKTVKLTVRMTPPEVAEVEVDVPDDTGVIESIEASAA